MKRIVINEELINVINQVRNDLEGRDILNLTFEYGKDTPRMFVKCEVAGKTYYQGMQEFKYVYYRDSEELECVFFN